MIINWIKKNFADYPKFYQTYIEKFNKKVKPSFLLQILHPAYNFSYNYLVRLGILDGIKGIIICHLNAYSVYIRYQELRKIWQKATISKN